MLTAMRLSFIGEFLPQAGPISSRAAATNVG